MLKKILLSLACVLGLVLPARAVVPSASAFLQYTLSTTPQTLPVTYVFQAPSDLLVLDSKASPPVVLVQNSDYTVQGGAGSTGSIIIIPGGTNGVQVGDVITILRGMPFTQMTNFTAGGPFSPTMVMSALDKLTMITQQLNVQLGNALQFQGDEVKSTILDLNSRKSTYLGFDANGNIAYYPAPGNTNVVTSIIAGAGISINPTNGIGNVTITNTGASSSPGGSAGQLQYNTGSAFGGTSGLTWSTGPFQLSNIQNTAQNSYGFINENTSTGAAAVTTYALANASFNGFSTFPTGNWALTGTSYSGSYLSGGPAGQAMYLYTYTNFPVVIGVNNVAVGQFTSTGINTTAIGQTIPEPGGFTALTATTMVASTKLTVGPLTSWDTVSATSYIPQAYNFIGAQNAFTTAQQTNYTMVLGNSNNISSANVTGLYAAFVDLHATGTRTSSAGFEGDAIQNAAGTTTGMAGTIGFAEPMAGVVTTAYGTLGQVTVAGGTVTNVIGAEGIPLETSGVITTSAGLEAFGLTQTGGTCVNNWGLLVNYVGTAGSSSNYEILAAGAGGTFFIVDSNVNVSTTSTTVSTSPTTGAIIDGGGLGVAGAIYAGSLQNTPVGSTTASTGAFTTLSASSTVSGSGFSTYLASPPAIGGSAPAAGNFTTLGATGIGSFTNTTQSTSAITGAVVDSGGLGVAKVLWVGGNLQMNGFLNSYDSIATAGWGLPVIYGYGRSVGQTGAVASVATYAGSASDGTFEVSANVLITASSSFTFTVTCTYHDEGNTSRTLTMPFTAVAGSPLTSIANAGGTVPYHGLPVHIRCKAGTSITIATTGTFGSVTYNVEGIIKQED